MKISDLVKEAIKEAKLKKDKSGSREYSYHSGYLDALEQIIGTIEIAELKNEKANTTKLG